MRAKNDKTGKAMFWKLTDHPLSPGLVLNILLYYLGARVSARVSGADVLANPGGLVERLYNVPGERTLGKRFHVGIVVRLFARTHNDPIRFP